MIKHGTLIIIAAASVLAETGLVLAKILAEWFGQSFSVVIGTSAMAEIAGRIVPYLIFACLGLTVSIVLVVWLSEDQRKANRSRRRSSESIDDHRDAASTS